MTIFSAPRPHVIDGVQFTHEGRPVFYGSPGCATAARDEVRRVVGVDAMKPPAAQVVLDRVQLPDGKTYGGLSHSEYDIEIADVALGPERPTPSLSIRATAGEARHFSSRTGPAVARLAPNVAKGLDSGGGRDVSGIRLGMSFDDADRIIRGHMTVGRVLETGPAGLQSEGQTALFHAARLYMRDDNMEMFLLLHAPPTVDRQVIGIVRTLTQPSGELSIEDFRQAVIDKYGEPSKLAGPLPERLEYLSERAMLRWTQCRLNPSQTREDPVWIENGQVSDWRSRTSPRVRRTSPPIRVSCTSSIGRGWLRATPPLPRNAARRSTRASRNGVQPRAGDFHHGHHACRFHDGGERSRLCSCRGREASRGSVGDNAPRRSRIDQEA